MLLLGSSACNAVPVTALGDPTKVKEGSERVVLMPNGQKVKAICLNGEWILGPQTLKFTADTLPNPATLSPGVPVSVTTPYGENVATVVNGEFRYLMPFRTTWAGRPPVSAVPVGTELQVTDFNNQKWVSDGTYWRPAQGRVLLAQASRTAGAALAVISNAVSAQFALAGGNPKVPAGMIIPYSKLRVESGAVKSGSTAAFSLAARLGTTGVTATDLAMGSVAGTVVSDGLGLRMDLLACFNQATDGFFRTGNTVPMGQSSGNMFMSSSPAVNTMSDMYVTFDVISGNTADSYSLGFYSIWLEA